MPRAVRADDGGYLLDKVIEWSDGSTERIQIDDDFFFILDGARRRLVGMDLSLYAPSASDTGAWWLPENLAFIDHELSYLESVGMRLIGVDVTYIRFYVPDEEESAYTALFDLFYAHKMLVIPLINFKRIPGFDNLEELNFSWNLSILGGPDEVDTMEEWTTRWATIVSRYSNVVAVQADNELDWKLPASELPFSSEDQNYTPENVEAHLTYFMGILRGILSVPIVHNLMMNRLELEIKQVCRDMVDIPEFDIYVASAAEIVPEIDYTLPWLGVTGNWWCREINCRVGGRLNSHGFTADWIDDVFARKATVAMMFTSNFWGGEAGFFDDYGDPIAALTEIARELERLQAPISEPPPVPTVITNYASNLTIDSARLNGHLDGLGTASTVDVSFQWGAGSGDYTSETAPQTMDAEGPFSFELTGLSSGATYYFRAKVAADVTTYGLEKSFTAGTPPAVTTGAAVNTTTSSSTLEATLGDLGTAPTVNVSFLWDVNPRGLANETNPQAMDVAGPFSVQLSGLTAGTSYYYQAKVVGDGTSYGEVENFTTEAIAPTVITSDASNIVANSARVTGTLDGLGSASTAEVSFQWGTTSSGPYPNETTPQEMDATGDFYFDLSGLVPGQTYYFRAKVVGDGTSYGEERSFTAQATPPMVTTNNATNAISTGAILNGSLSELGTASTVDVSFQLGTSPGDYTSETIPQAMDGTGQFSSEMTSLNPGQTCYFRAKAVGNGTSYGAENTFTTTTTPIPTSAPTLSSPSDGSSVSGNSVTFAWNPVDVATRYWIRVGTDPDFTQTNAFLGRGYWIYGAASKAWPGFPNDGTTYYWKVCADDGSGWGDWSSIRSFVKPPGTALAPTLSSPADGAEVCGTTVAFRWDPVDGATTYRIRVGTDPDLTSASLFTGKDYLSYGHSSRTHTGFGNDGATYYWKVCADDGSGWGDWSSTWSFTNGGLNKA